MFTDQELNDILNCISIAKKSGAHKDSPQFWRAVGRLEKKTWRILRRKEILKPSYSMTATRAKPASSFGPVPKTKKRPRSLVAESLRN